MISAEFVADLACPVCRSPLRLEGERLICTLADCGCRYKVADDIPDMLIDDAERPCPGCAAPRTWDGEKDTLSCPSCKRIYVAPPPGVSASKT